MAEGCEATWRQLIVSLVIGRKMGESAVRPWLYRPEGAGKIQKDGLLGGTGGGSPCKCTSRPKFAITLDWDGPLCKAAVRMEGGRSKGHHDGAARLTHQIRRCSATTWNFRGGCGLGLASTLGRRCSGAGSAAE
jgi:hypothetical protein